MSGCYFCDGGGDVLESHHIVPRRFGGSDSDENLVDLCPTCHERIERLYNRRFYQKLGVAQDGSHDRQIAKAAVAVARSSITSDSPADAIVESDLRIDPWDHICPNCIRLTTFEDGVCQLCGGDRDD